MRDRLELEPNVRSPTCATATSPTLPTALHRWTPSPAGTEGYRKAEVTAGGVDTRELDSRSCESRLVPGLHFIGEVVDVDRLARRLQLPVGLGQRRRLRPGAGGRLPHRARGL